jgi:hypothetical protein
MKVELLKLKEGLQLPLWATNEKNIYDVNFIDIQILNPDQLMVFRHFVISTITVIGPGMRFGLSKGHIRFGTDKLTVYQILLQTPQPPVVEK